MTLKSGIVQIDKVDDAYLVSTSHQGVTSSLGSYNTLKDAVETPLSQSSITPIVKEALQAIQAKGKQLEWDEAKLGDLFH